MRILAIESSCDDTAVAYLEVTDGQVSRLEQVVASQLVHANYGGVVPEVAAREHSAKLPALLKELAQRVVGTADGVALGEVVDLVAATAGPGLATSLRVGLDTARALAAAWGKPFRAVNHIAGHIAANWLPTINGPSPLENVEGVFPAVVLVVSGGHTELQLLRGAKDFELRGATLDDAAGEAFDKTAKLIGLGYPGGPAISRTAANGDPKTFDFPRPLLGSGDGRFSFSGLKTAVRYFVEKDRSRLSDPQFMANLAASVEKAIVEVLVSKTVWAAESHQVKTVLLAGGVAANRELRRLLRAGLAERLSDVRLVEPPIEYCTDNAAMIAMAAVLDEGQDDWKETEADPNWELGRTKE
ncbi:MAG: tRNA (adenosine(37)-N6)-threonylcarbamoyltransferase complex transferase subunit TsaD [bacterium]